ncbi:MAG: hypothetical protein H0U12_07135 [Thermoleophilaceae bacterium]|nr:hypothetical protein [Thermoleophilaceae bacterium]
MSLLQSEFATVLGAIETTFGVQAVAGFMQHQPNPGGIQDFYAQLVKIARSPLSKNLMDEKGSVVDLNAMPKLVQDLNKDLLDRYSESAFRSAAKFPGGTGVGRWVKGTLVPAPNVTGVTATGYTVSSGGALPAQVLVNARGFTNAANNGLKVVTVGSVAAEVKAAGLVVEASPPEGASLEVVGFQGTSGDLGIDATGRITSTTMNFTTLGIQPGSFGWLGGGTAAAPGALGFGAGVSTNRGFFRFNTVAANLITPDRKTQAWTTDAGAAKTIQVFFGPWWRNVAGDHTDYRRSSSTLELMMPGLAAGGITAYVYALGCSLGLFELSAPLTEKVIATCGFVGTNVTDPTTVRTAGAVSAITPQQSAAFTTAKQNRRIRVSNASDELVILNDIQSWNLSISNNITPYKKQGVEGAAEMIFGKFQIGLTLDGALGQTDTWQAIRDNRTCSFDAALTNSDGCVLYDVPALTLEGGAPSFAAQDVARFSTTAKTFRDPTWGFVGAQTLFPYLPAD